MSKKNVRRLGLLAALATGRVPARRRLAGLVIRRSVRIARAVLWVRIFRRVFRAPVPTVVSVRTPRSVIDVEAR